LEVRNGFIVGIFNYCDSWCAHCPFTSRCRLFADAAEIDASLDPNLKAVVEAPPLPEDIPPPPPAWLQELIDVMNAAASAPASSEEPEWIQPRVAPEHEHIDARATSYRARVRAWLRDDETSDMADVDRPRDVVAWFHTLIPARVHRALTGLACGDDDHLSARDHDGSAKVALVGIQRSHAAWLDLADRGRATDAEAASFIGDLIWLADELDRVFPRARAFVRPAFDEPDEVARLEAGERR
jgi:hypothetical protein